MSDGDYQNGFTAGFQAGWRARYEDRALYDQWFNAGYNPGFKAGFKAGWSANPGHDGAPFEMFDSVDVSTVPPDPAAVAGYVDGRYGDYGQLVARFPNARHLSIAVFESDDADCADCELTDMTAEQLPGWVRRQQARGVARPAVYCSLEGTPDEGLPWVAAALKAAGIGREEVRLWIAHYTYQAHICSQIQTAWGVINADATQWTDTALGRNLDESLCRPDFL